MTLQLTSGSWSIFPCATIGCLTLIPYISIRCCFHLQYELRDLKKRDSGLTYLIIHLLFIFTYLLFHGLWFMSLIQILSQKEVQELRNENAELAKSLKEGLSACSCKSQMTCKTNYQSIFKMNYIRVPKSYSIPESHQ